jgi:hypothetical protein
LDRPQEGRHRVRLSGLRRGQDTGIGGRTTRLSERIVGIETTDKLTDPQIVAKMKEHYGIDR